MEVKFMREAREPAVSARQSKSGIPHGMDWASTDVAPSAPIPVGILFSNTSSKACPRLLRGVADTHPMRDLRYGQCRGVTKRWFDRMSRCGNVFPENDVAVDPASDVSGEG